MTRIPKVLHELIDTAFPANVCLVATVLANGYAQVTPRGSAMVFDDEHIGWWERGKGSTTANLADGSRVTVFYRNQKLRDSGELPLLGGIARFYGTARLHKSGSVYDEIWKRVIPSEKEKDPERKGYGVLVKVERAEALDGKPLRDILS